jgi:hypothetical protein
VKKLDVITQNQNHFRNQGVEIVQKLSILCEISADLCYLQKGKTIIREYYTNLLQRLSNEIKRKWPHLARKKVLLHQDKAPVHKSAMAKINELKLKLIPHPPYSSDLVFSDYIFSPNLKKWLGCKRFASNEHMESVVNSYFGELDGFHYKKGIGSLKIAVRGVSS